MYATKEENQLIKCSILYPMIMTILNRDLTMIQQSSVKFPRPYIELIEATLTQVSYRLHDVKKEMYSKGIKVTEKNKLDEAMEYDVIVRGYHEVMRYSKYHLRNQAELWLCKLFFLNKGQVQATRK
jgi:hypothetical protein